MNLFGSSHPWRIAVILPTPSPAFLAGRSRSCEVTLNHFGLRSPISKWALEFVHHQPVAVDRQPLIQQRPPAGSDATRVHLVNTMNTPIEVVEASFSIQVERQRLRSGSGGAGQFPGGYGFVREYTMLADNMVLTTCVNRITVPPHGICGGEDGEPFALSLVRADGSHHVPPGRCNESLGRGDAVTIETSGGGGYGPPPER